MSDEREFDQVIFLDIDGVLNRAGTQERVDGRFMGLDAALLARFKRLLGQVNAEVVLSSTWRLYPNLLAVVRREIPLLDVTPEVEGSRGTQIRTWLAFNPEVERFAILDDDRDMLPEQLPSCFFTDTWVGLTEEIAEAVREHLTAPLPAVGAGGRA